MPTWKVLSLLWLVGCTLLWSGFNALAATPTPTATPTYDYDPLAIPVLPKNPSAFERGKYLYYFHCMPCHGDLGQGLTDDFRSVWEEHSNCWGRGCHAGRQRDEGFPIPTVVPAVIGGQQALARFADLAALRRYLHDTHPPQRPGKLKDEEYEALAVYLWTANQRPLPVESEAQPTTIPTLTATFPTIAMVAVSPSTVALTAPETEIQSNPTQKTPASGANSRLSPVIFITLIFILLGSLVTFLARRMKGPLPHD